MVEQYVKAHSAGAEYLPCGNGFCHPLGWVDTPVGQEMVYSHRSTYYTKERFTEGLHAHEYYELVIYVSGEVEYIKENARTVPVGLTAVCFPPGLMHTAKLNAASHYERYVMYFTPAFFTLDGSCTPMTAFADAEGSFALRIPEGMVGEVRDILARADEAAASSTAYAGLLLRAHLTALFGLLNSSAMQREQAHECADTIAAVKQYIDREYATIVGICDIAEAFFYSREHLSRAFRQAYNISISKYLAKRRVMESLPLLQKMSVTDAALGVGFHSQSAYIAAFRQHVGCLPSVYKARYK